MSFRASVLTLYPEMFPGPLGLSLAGQALARRLVARNRPDPRFRHRPPPQVDDTPAGGGAGMVLRADVLARGHRSRLAGERRTPAPSDEPARPAARPGARTRTGQGPGAVIVCGRFEGVDQRVIEAGGSRRSRSATTSCRAATGGPHPARRGRPAPARRDGQPRNRHP